MRQGWLAKVEKVVSQYFPPSRITDQKPESRCHHHGLSRRKDLRQRGSDLGENSGASDVKSTSSDGHYLIIGPALTLITLFETPNSRRKEQMVNCYQSQKAGRSTDRQLGTEDIGHNAHQEYADHR